MVLTDPLLASPRSISTVVAEALAAGVRSIQLRDKTASARELYAQARVLLHLTRPAGALLFINDRLDVAVAAGADGVHLGPDDLSVRAARAWAPDGFYLGYSTDDPEMARSAASDGADYIGCGAVFGTTSKDVGGEAIGLDRLRAVVHAVQIPVVAIGGIGPETAGAVASTGAAGIAVLSAVMAAPDPRAAAGFLLSSMGGQEP
jgi:thiamine-phosphate pyrophosphorylase